MPASRVVQLVALACCVGLVAIAATRIQPINAGRTALNIMSADQPVQDTPPEYVFWIQAFGAFRGLIADIAFIRADQLKQEGRFYDAMELHKWLCRLQPYFPAVWEYASWNMAWNISVTTYTPQERWNWVYNGVKLLRDQGIPVNPRAVNLYKQLAWTFNNKMSESTDEHHYAYKCNWAWRMHLLLGPPPDPYRDVDQEKLVDEITSIERLGLLAEAAQLTWEQFERKRREMADKHGWEYVPQPPPDLSTDLPTAELEITPFKLAQRAAVAQVQALDQAPPALDELYARVPAARATISELRSLGIDISDDPLDEDRYWREDGLAFAFFTPYRKLTTRASALAEISALRLTSYTESGRMQQLDRILGVTENNPVGRAVVRFLQRKVLTEVYKLEPRYMLEVLTEFGPVDWRSVDAQGLYWATRGLIASGESPSDFSNDKMNTARILFFCCRNLWLRGNLTFEPPAEVSEENIHLSYLNVSRDLNFIEPMHQAYVRFGPMFDSDTRGARGAGDTFRSGHVNFLSEAIRLLYLAGREREAAYYYSYVRETYGQTPDGRPNPAVQMPLHDYVMKDFRDSVFAAGLREIKIILDAWLYAAYSELAAGNFASHARRVRAAERYYEEYMKDKRDDPLIARVKLQPFRDLEADALMAWLTEPAPTPAFTLHKSRLWKNTPLYLRQAVFDRPELSEWLGEECRHWNFSFDKAFPEPPGMAEYRAQRGDRTRDPDQDGVRTLPRRTE